MKTIKQYAFILLSVLAGAVSQSCQEEIDTSDRYTFTQETLASYLSKHEAYSEYYKILGEVPISQRSKSTVQQLLSARGHYTVFAPTNEAIQEYLDSLYRKGVIITPSWDGFRSENDKDSIKKVIVYNSIIDSGDDYTDVGIYTSSFPKNNEEFNEVNLNERRLIIAIDDNNNYYINGTRDKDNKIIGGSLLDVRNRDIPAINGVMHQVHDVIAPSNQTLSGLLNEFIEKGEEFTGIAQLISTCGLEGELGKTRDLEYEDLVLTEAIQDLTSDKALFKICQIPDHKDYGFTIFAEQDDFWEANLGVNPKTTSKEEFARLVKDWVVKQGFYPDATDDENYSDPKNALYQFITYHIIPARIPKNSLVIHYTEKGYDLENPGRLTIPVYDYQTTMGKRRLIKFYESKQSNGIYLNRFPRLNNERDGDYMENGCDDSKQGFLVNDAGMREVLNGYIYPITPAGATGPAALAYDQQTRENLQKERIRFDATSMFPELLSNNIKLTYPKRMSGQANWGFPIDNDYKYLSNLSIEAGTLFTYLPGLDRASGRDATWCNYQADEFNVSGSYEFTITLPPVPMRSIYEIRFAIQSASGNRGMCQVYFGTNPETLPAMGIPLDMRLQGATGRTIMGWEEENPSDPDYNSIVDKRMRNLGYMKGPQYYCIFRGPKTARSVDHCSRRIIVREEMDPDQTYYIKFKTVLENTQWEFFMDYLEFCAKEVYDNEETPEDIW